MGTFKTRRLCKLQRMSPQGHGAQENGPLRKHGISENSFHVCITVKGKRSQSPSGKISECHNLTAHFTHEKKERDRGENREIQLFKKPNQ